MRTRAARAGPLFCVPERHVAESSDGPGQRRLVGRQRVALLQPSSVRGCGLGGVLEPPVLDLRLGGGGGEGVLCF